MRALSSSERKILENHHYIVKITEKHIVFTEEFKLFAIQRSAEGMPREVIFNGTFGVSCFDKKFMDSCLSRWRKKHELFGGFEESRGNKRGRRKSTKNMTIEELEAEVAYLKKVNAHLKKVRGLTDDDL